MFVLELVTLVYRLRQSRRSYVVDSPPDHRGANQGIWRVQVVRQGRENVGFVVRQRQLNLLRIGAITLL